LRPHLSRDFVYVLLNWLAIAAGSLACACVFGQDGRALLSLPLLTELLCVTIATVALNHRTVVMRRDADGTATLTHIPGDGLLVITLLRHGVAAAVAVRLLTDIADCVLKAVRARRVAVRHFAVPLYNAALFALLGWLYHRFGGQPLLTATDSALFFQRPTAILLPLIGAIAVVLELVDRPFIASIVCARGGGSIRKELAEATLTYFDYLERLSGAFILALWSAWGWATLPFTLLMNEALLFSARAYFQRLDARRDSDCDPLTGLASWRKLDIVLQKRVACSRQKHTSFAVLFLDVDGLKRVNDTFGHNAGDDLLRVVGERCLAHAQPGDTVGRRGGDEFLLVLDGLGRGEAESLLRRLQFDLERTLAENPQFAQSAAGASMGLAVYPHDAYEAEQLVEVADRQMYANKRARKAALLAA